MKEDIAIITTDSDMYFDCVLFTQDNTYLDLADKHIIIILSVRDDEFIVEYDGKNSVNKNCILKSGKEVGKVCPYFVDKYGNKKLPLDIPPYHCHHHIHHCHHHIHHHHNHRPPFTYGYVDALEIHIPKGTFSESGVMKIQVCNITEPDGVFNDANQEVWSLVSRTNIKYKNYEQ